MSAEPQEPGPSRDPFRRPPVGLPPEAARPQYAPAPPPEEAVGPSAPRKGSPFRFVFAAPFIYAATAIAFLYPLAETDIVISAGLTTLLAGFLALPLARSHVRSWALVGAAWLGTLLAMWAGDFVSGSFWFAE